MTENEQNPTPAPAAATLAPVERSTSVKSLVDGLGASIGAKLAQGPPTFARSISSQTAQDSEDDGDSKPTESGSTTDKDDTATAGTDGPAVRRIPSPNTIRQKKLERAGIKVSSAQDPGQVIELSRSLKIAAKQGPGRSVPEFQTKLKQMQKKTSATPVLQDEFQAALEQQASKEKMTDAVEAKKRATGQSELSQVFSRLLTCE
eukprot:m.33739 g.33739  ORF g.33739 m.33739 type:complete len:204 (-) comp10499_c0_seq1:93-704(-)